MTAAHIPASAGPTATPALSARSRRWLPTLLVGVPLTWLVLVPLALLVATAFKPTGLLRDPGFTLENFTSTFGGARFWLLAWRTAIFAVASAVAALVLGAALAWLVERTDLPRRGLFRVLIMLPMTTPPFLVAMGWIMLLSPRTGVVNLVLQQWFGLASPPMDVFTMPGMIFVETLSLVPSAFLMLAPSFRNLDASLEEAAAIAGSSPGRVLRRVVLPLVAPALAATGIYLLIVGFVTFDVPATIGMPSRIMLLSTEIYGLANDNPRGIPDYGRISAMSVAFIAALLLLTVLYQRILGRASRYVTVTGKAFRPRPFHLGVWRIPAAIAVGLYFLLAAVLPLAMLGWMSLMPYQAPVSAASAALATSANHRALLDNVSIVSATGNSLVIAIVAACAVVAMSFAVSWVAVRSQAPGRRAVDMVAILPIAIPGVLLATAMIYTYLVVSFVPIYGTIWIICLAYVTLYVSFGTRTTNAVLMQMHPELEEAARVGGAGTLRTLRRITAPIVGPALLSVWIWVFAHCLRELSAAVMLQGLDNATVTTLLFTYWNQGEPTTAAALGVWLILCLLVVLALWYGLNAVSSRPATNPGVR